MRRIGITFWFRLVMQQIMTLYSQVDKGGIVQNIRVHHGHEIFLNFLFLHSLRMNRFHLMLSYSCCEGDGSHVHGELTVSDERNSGSGVVAVYVFKRGSNKIVHIRN